MTRRPGRSRRLAAYTLPTDPFLQLSADHAWRARDVTDNGVNTTSLVPYIGALTLTRTATGQGLKTTAATLRGATIVPFDGVAGNAGYSGAFAVPAAMTVATVFRCLVTGSAAHSVTVGGVSNTGNSSGFSGGNAFAQKVASATLKALAVPVDAVLLAVVDGNGPTVYANSFTGVSASVAGALAGDTFNIGSLATVGTFVMNGQWATTGVWRRALSSAEIALVIRSLSVVYGVAIAP